MTQEVPPKVPGSLAEWLPVIGFVLLALWKLYEVVRAGLQKKEEDKAQLIARATSPVEHNLKNAMQTIDILTRKESLLEKENTELKRENEDLERELAECQKVARDYFALRGDFERIEERVAELERRKTR